jgi:hypothetical protein
VEAEPQTQEESIKRKYYYAMVSVKIQTRDLLKCLKTNEKDTYDSIIKRLVEHYLNNTNKG